LKKKPPAPESDQREEGGGKGPRTPAGGLGKVI